MKLIVVLLSLFISPSSCALFSAGDRFPIGIGIFLCHIMSRQALGPTQHLIQWELKPIPWGVKWPDCEPDHIYSSSAEIKNPWSSTSTPPYVFRAWY